MKFSIINLGALMAMNMVNAHCGRGHRHHNSVNPFEERDRHHLNYYINKVCDNGQCNIDFTFGRGHESVKVRLQTIGCPSKAANLSAMYAAARDLTSNAENKSTCIAGCTVYMSWRYDTRNYPVGQRYGQMNISGYGEFL
ncbi:hypothetical protein AYI69_g3840 [Smittium culicis]|uniref:Ecp2 effector protein domain-containing protein n=1 Tax=Smittium culicis TaxID=133412 RepID=A0A1R1YJ50_9FUNG|nr:hypothetical protein AYI69_g3840 [Smittium culicis]